MFGIILVAISLLVPHSAVTGSFAAKESLGCFCKVSAYCVILTHDRNRGDRFKAIAFLGRHKEWSLLLRACRRIAEEESMALYILQAVSECQEPEVLGEIMRLREVFRENKATGAFWAGYE